MSCPVATCPTIAGFTAFLRSAGFNSTVLPDNSPVIQEAFCAAREVVNPYIQQVAPSAYNLAYYNWGTDYVLNYATDAGDPPPVYKEGLPFFEYWRKKLNTMGFVSGVITSASDQGTSQSMVVSENNGNLSLGDLQLTKTFWGRNYLAIAQKWGPDLFGIS